MNVEYRIFHPSSPFPHQTCPFSHKKVNFFHKSFVILPQFSTFAELNSITHYFGVVKNFIIKTLNVENERNSRRFESVYSKKVRAGKRRTYFFDVRQTKGDDYYLTLTESTRKFNQDGYERHKIFLYKEDFNRFLEGLEDAINYVKTELMPDYDYDEYTRRHEEWEASQQASDDRFAASDNNSSSSNNNGGVEEIEDDISW